MSLACAHNPRTARFPAFAHCAHARSWLKLMMRRRVDVRLATQVLLQVAVVVLALGIAGGLLAVLSHNRLAAEYETRALDVARAVAFTPSVRADVARYDAARLTPSPALTAELANGQMQQLASEVQ